MRSLSVDRIIINPEYIEATVSISGFLSTFVFNLSFVENPKLKEPTLNIRDEIIEIIKKHYIKESLLK